MAKSALKTIPEFVGNFWPLAPSQVFAIQAVCVLTGLLSTDRVLRDRAIVVEGDLIAAVTDWGRSAVPHGVEVIDTRAAIVIPGLIEALCHVTREWAHKHMPPTSSPVRKRPYCAASWTSEVD